MRRLIVHTYSCAVAFLPLVARAQFKEIGPAPYSAVVARQKIRASLEALTPSYHKQTIETLTNLVPWYRDILDDELIVAWKRDSRANLPELIESLADARVASEIIAYSWREQRPATFTLTYAPMLGDLMARYPKSAAPFLEDLLDKAPVLSQPEAETVCRILVDMPELGEWRKNALRILPQYRQTAEKLLRDDMANGSPEKSYTASVWLTDLKFEAPKTSKASGNPPRTTVAAPPSPASSVSVNNQPSLSATPPRAHVDYSPPVLQSDSQPPPKAATPPPPPAPLKASAYNGATSGTFESSGSPIPQNAEYVFRNLPPVKLQLDYDRALWDVRLLEGDPASRKLIARNKSSGPQKRCVVHWKAIP